MKTDNASKLRSDRVWLGPDDCDLEEFAASVERTASRADYPFAADIRSDVPVYDCDRVREASADPDTRRAIMAEWAEAMLSGPGIVVLQRAYAAFDVIDEATDVFFAMIAEEKAANRGGGDHFAKPGANDRIWNALEKLCLRNPELFARYYSNPVIVMICEAWLGPHYQITSQINVVNPGGEAQSAHRDYHMGFQSADEIARFPAHVHRLSPVMTLQGAVAHVDMPMESGPTLYLPFSQCFEPGYFAWRRPEFKAYFDAHRVQLPLRKGDAAFFNPALFHAAGHNRTKDVRRMANLLQVSSAYGRAMESVDRAKMCAVLYPALLKMKAEEALDASEIACAVAACAEGYSFPTNLDRDPPLGGLAPETQAALMTRALAEGMDEKTFAAALAQHQWRRQT